MIFRCYSFCLFNGYFVFKGSVRAFHEHGDGKKKAESWDDYDKRYIGFFKDPNLDGWWLRKHLQEIHTEDCVADPKVAAEVLRACRRLNDFGMAVRFLESCRFKAGPNASSVMPYMYQELKPVMDELGIPTLEELGYDKPELACPKVEDL